MRFSFQNCNVKIRTFFLYKRFLNGFLMNELHCTTLRVRNQEEKHISHEILKAGGVCPRCQPRIYIKSADGVVKLINLIFQEKLSICARRFPKGDRKALWWGDGAKPHILEMLRFLFLEMFGLSLTAPKNKFCTKSGRALRAPTFYGSGIPLRGHKRHGYSLRRFLIHR